MAVRPAAGETTKNRMRTTPGEDDNESRLAHLAEQSGSGQAHGPHTSLRWKQGEDVLPFFLSNAAAVDLCSSILDGTVGHGSRKKSGLRVSGDELCVGNPFQLLPTDHQSAPLARDCLASHTAPVSSPGLRA